MGYYDLPEEGLEAIKEHALSNYLPFSGGLRQHYQIRNFGRNKKPKGKVRFYAVEYRPPSLTLLRSPIHLDNETTFNVFDQSLREGEPDYLDYSNKIKFYKWGTERGFDFMELKFSWYISNQMQDWIVSRKPDYPNLEECTAWVEEKLKRDGSDYKLTTQDLDDIETAYEFQTSDLN